jgi:hypothetical protein
MGGSMIIKIFLLLILGISMANVSFALPRDPSIGGESSSTGVWPSVGSDSSVGYGSGDHGNVS